jgi:hypothetical protein
MLYYTVMYYAVLCYAKLCYAMLCYAKQGQGHRAAADAQLPCEVLLERLLALAAHPLPACRAGAVGALSHMHLYLREETPLVSKLYRKG